MPSVNNTIWIDSVLQSIRRIISLLYKGLSYLEVQFWWTLRHFQKPTFVTLVRACNSGASFLNRVELQNRCLSLAHSNLFIPSNLNWSCFDPATGNLNKEWLRANMNLATDKLYQKSEWCSLRWNTDTSLQGADSSQLQELRKHLLTFLKGSKKQKAQLKQ